MKNFPKFSKYVFGKSNLVTLLTANGTYDDIVLKDDNQGRDSVTWKISKRKITANATEPRV